MSLRRITHVVLSVADLDRSTVFYRDVLGLAISASLNAPIPETTFGVFRM